MQDYKVKLSIDNAASPELKKIKQQLKDSFTADDVMKKLRQQFEGITNSTKPLKTQLRQIQTMMANMNMDGLSNTDLFNEMAQQAGSLSDAIGDASTAVRRYASDTRKLDAGIQAFQLGTAAIGVYTGAMQMLGIQNEEVAKAMQKAQAALTLLSGVQAIANALNKDSALMQNLNTMAINIRTAATAKATVAENAWNTAKAIGKALLGDFTGIAILAAAGLATYAIATSDATEDEKEHNKTLKELSDTYNNKYISTLVDTRSKYEELRSKYQELRTEHEKQKFIEDNKNAFKQLGIEVNNVTSAENVFVKNSQKVIDALTQRAIATAKLALAQEQYKRALQADKKEGVRLDTSNMSEEQITALEKSGRIKKDSGSAWSRNEWRNGAFRNAYVFTAKEDEVVIKNAEKGLKKSIAEAISIENKAATQLSSLSSGGSSSNNSGGGSSHSGRGGSNNTSNKKDEYIPLEGSIDEINQQIQELQRQYNAVATDAERSAIQQEIAWKKVQLSIRDGSFQKEQIEKQKKENETKLKLEERFKQQMQAIQDKLNQEAYNKLVEESKKNREALENAQNNAGGNYDVSSYDSVVEKINEIKTLAEDNPMMGLAGGAIALGQAMQQLGQDSAIGKAGMILGAIGQVALSFAKALTSCNTWVEWLAFGISGAATMVSLISQIKGFADGGIIQGSNFHGDTMVARVNAGEMILNQKQQSNLFNLLNNGGGMNGAPSISFKIKGSDLYGTLRNYNAKLNKIK